MMIRRQTWSMSFVARGAAATSLPHRSCIGHTWSAAEAWLLHAVTFGDAGVGEYRTERDSILGCSCILQGVGWATVWTLTGEGVMS